MNHINAAIAQLQLFLPQITGALRQHFIRKDMARCVAILFALHNYINTLDAAYGQRQNPITGDSVGTLLNLIQSEIRSITAFIQSGRFDLRVFTHREQRLLHSINGMIAVLRQLA